MRDPLDSPVWNDLAKRYLSDGRVVFDDRVRVVLPKVTEDQTQVPIGVDARALGDVDEIKVIVDLHPFPQPLTLEPVNAAPFVAYRQKIEQGTPIRAAARQGDTWYVGGAYLDAAGGGCSAPPAVIGKVDWERLGELRGQVWREGETARLRIRLQHPMDNGLMANIPAFFIETLTVADEAGNPLAKLRLSEAIAANPTLTLLPALPKAGTSLTIAARDNDGGEFKGRAPIPAASAISSQEGRL